ncbi:MAG: MCE family protein [Elusimicrobia bacterium]|nr:MCE family protein [Elusimicrobiota bacterium]
MNVETKVGAFTLAALAVLAAGILVLGDIQFRSTYDLHIIFDDAEGLPDKGPVKVAGVEVGKVDRIQLVDQRAKVTVRLAEGVQAHEDAKAYVSATGLIGSKYLELTLGSPSAPLLKEGATIQGEPSFSFDDVMKQLQEFFRDDPELGSVSDNVRATAANLRRVTDALNTALAKQEKALEEIVLNTRDLSRHAKNVSASLDEITQEKKEDIKVALAKIRSVSERLDSLLAKVEKGEGTVGKLMSDDEMGQSLKQTFADVQQAAKEAKTILGRISMVEVYWDYRQRYDFEDRQARADLGLRIVPRPGKFYFVQGNNLGAREDRKLPGSDLEKKNTVTGVMGRDFGPFTLYGGAIRSSGGAGIRYRPFRSEEWSRRFELEAEAYDIPRDEVIQGRRLDSPVYNAGARVTLADPWLWLGGRVEDIAERRNLNAYLNITFKDEDIAYLLGFVGLAR